MQAITLMTIMITADIAIILYSTFLVAINRMTKANKIEEMIPFWALLTKAASVGIHGQTLLVWAKVLSPVGASFSLASTNP